MPFAGITKVSNHRFIVVEKNGERKTLIEGYPSNQIKGEVSTPVEVHQLYTVTNTLTYKDLTQMLIDYMTPLVIKQAEQEQHKPSVPQKHWPTMEQQSPKKKSA